MAHVNGPTRSVPFQRLTWKRYLTPVAAGLLLIAAGLIVSPGIGTEPIGLLDAWRSLVEPAADDATYRIAFMLRMPRAMLALLAGGTLAVCGAVFQAIFRNPLATPYTLGIASGGSLGALVALKVGIAGAVLGISTVPLFGFAGSLMAVGVVYAIARRPGVLTTNDLLLAGITIGLFCSSAMMFVTYLADVTETFGMIRWLMGSLGTVGYGDALSMLPFVLPAWAYFWLRGAALNQLLLGEEIAATRGVRVKTLQITCIVLASLATAAVVALCGPIGFVGLIVPHAGRKVFGPDNRVLLPVSILIGGAFLIVADWFSVLCLGWYGQLIGREMSTARLPIGVVTAMCGAPVFLSILRSRTGRT